MKILFIISLFLVLATPSFSAEKVKNDRQKVIDFEGDVVEGVNKKPLDSLNQLSEAEKRRRRPHLYQKRRGFRSETQESLRELRYSQ